MRRKCTIACKHRLRCPCTPHMCRALRPAACSSACMYVYTYMLFERSSTRRTLAVLLAATSLTGIRHHNRHPVVVGKGQRVEHLASHNRQQVSKERVLQTEHVHCGQEKQCVGEIRGGTCSGSAAGQPRDSHTDEWMRAAGDVCKGGIKKGLTVSQRGQVLRC